jgi:antitoxin component YwqK of YwqJK toxin-antitoxin module
MAGVTTILAEISKVKSITLVADVLQNNKKIQTKISITSGKLDVVSSILYNSGKPRCTLIAHINNIKNIDINKINPQSGSSGMMQAIGITGQYTEYGENGKVSYQSPWTPDTSDIVLAKMALMMQ